MEDLYKLLEVNETASADVIRAAYKTLAMINHPDKARDSDRALKEEKMKKLNYARDVLLDPERREKYDMELRLERNRQQNEIIESKVQQSKNKEAETKQKRKSKISNVAKQYDTKTPQNMGRAVTGAFGSFFKLFKNPKKNKNIIMISACLFLFAFAQVFLCLFLFSNSSNQITIGKKTTVVENKIIPNETTEEDIIAMFGEPKRNEGNVMEYKDHAKILLNDEHVVIGWLDNYKELNFRKNTVGIKQENISVGMKRQLIISKFGYPDTYSDQIFVYGNIIIYFENGVVSRVEKE
jgi:curved DNA-binding protein CbpA